MSKVPKIVLSGGPCGGKTESLSYIKRELEKFGFNVFVINEAASLVLEQGFNRNKSAFEFQKAIALKQIEIEEKIEKLAQKSKNPVIICDRGLMDCRVYLNNDEFLKIKNYLRMSDVDLRDRYDAAFHLDSTSNNDKIKYEFGNLRIENKEDALILNQRSLKAWCGNPHYRFIPVCSTIEEKQELLLQEIKHFLGVPKPLEIERKYLIKYPDINYLMSLICEKVEISQSYMVNKNGDRFRLRSRGNKDSSIYIKTEKNKISETIREEIETRLTKEEYANLLKNNTVIGSITKDRYCLMHNGTYFEIDIFPFWKKQAYLEVELLDENDIINFPEFINIIEEVTYKPEYKNIALCNHIPKEL